MPPGLTKPVSEQPGATWKQHTNQTINHNSIIPNQCSETSFHPNHFTSLLCSLFRFRFTFLGVMRWPTPSGGVQRNSQRLGELRSLPLPHQRGRSATGNYRSIWVAKTRYRQKGRGGVAVHNMLLRKGPPFLSLAVPLHTHLLGSQCLPPKETCLSKPETGEKERNYLFKSYTDSE